MNYFVTEGNVLADATLRQTHAGKPVANAVIRVDWSVRNDDGSYADGPTSDYEVTVYGKPAEAFAFSARRGARVFAAGETVRRAVHRQRRRLPAAPPDHRRAPRHLHPLRACGQHPPQRRPLTARQVPGTSCPTPP